MGITSSNHQFSGDMFVFREFNLPKTKITLEKWWLGDDFSRNFQELIQFLTHIFEIGLKPPSKYPPGNLR